ncbi:ubiquitin carboxyl-terminal hydrolase 32 [Achroia grisella]|uniref:ubiquitin carboxyl-terminal hydrolase 32 n=1 Tax=Achroia grisella TaxID=688607 RepID=UPI0027D28F44|nr:ubiquitin carboxyl-terminal hydrolase 32 [Achroia grisella]
MGAKDSKLSFISYEDAEKRVSDSEVRRIREAFKRCATPGGTTLSLDAFVHEVLCDGVPYEVAEWLYQACGGTKRGIGFRDLLRGIVVLTKGNLEEKIKFLWTLYVNNQSDNGTFIYKKDFAKALHLENTSLPVTEATRSTEILLSLFGAGEKVTFEQFRSWLLIHKDATVLSKWLLTDRKNVAQELETPTFYQSLAGVTHLEERDIIELEKCFWALRNSAATGQLDAESLTPLVSPPLPRAAVTGTFLALDENRDGHVDFKELCCGLSAACRGPRTERLKFCFKIFDLDRDGVLNKKELIDMVGILCTVANESLKNQSSRASTPSDGNDSDTEKGFDPEVILVNLREKLVTIPKDGLKPVFQLGPTSEGEEIVVTKEEDTKDEGLIANDMALALQDFLIWSVESVEALVTPFLELLFEVCHIVLGLRPQCKHQERDIVLGWLRREVHRGYSVGQFWYLVSAEWWNNWLAYTAAGNTDHCCRGQPRPLDEAIVCDESFTSNSTESMGSLWPETASVGSGGSSSGVSSAPAPRHHPHPGPVDNRRLLAPDLLKVRTLTGEGGQLRRDVPLVQGIDLQLLPDALWRAVALWYGAPHPLPRQVIRPPNCDVELELYPLQLKIFQHVTDTQRTSPMSALGGAGVSVYSSVPLAPASAPSPPERHLAYTASFSRLATVKQVWSFLSCALGLPREDVRLWALGGGGAVLLDDERPALHQLRLPPAPALLLERRNPDLTWPEEIGALGAAAGWERQERRDTLSAAPPAAAAGLHNLGNTCFMNAAMQAVWNTTALREYFNSGLHLYEVNRTNPLGTKGMLACRYGELCQEVWSGRARSVAPLRVRWCVSRHARALGGGGQHDAQELLAWLLDALHEDLNRAALHPPAPLHPPPSRDSDGRPDQEVAAEAWASYTARNRSIMTELFYGQLKSKVRCDTCGHESVRFDTFNMLSLPLPMESTLRCDVRVMRLDGSVPVKYGVRISTEGTYLDLKNKLSELCSLPADCMLVAEVSGATIGRVCEDAAKVSPTTATQLYAYELPPHRTGAGPGAGDDSDDDHCDCCGDCDGDDDPTHNECWWEGSPRAEVSVGGGGPSSLCMPALFCFKRSRSEIVMSQSPPNSFYGNKLPPYSDHPARPDRPAHRSNTLPKDLKRANTSSPTLSVKSLNVKPTTPKMGKVKFTSSPSNMFRMNGIENPLQNGSLKYIIAVHRKESRAEAYFVRWKATLFGVPLVLPLRRRVSGRDLYAAVWTQVARLLSAKPPSHDLSNHATDCDDSLGYEFPFRLRLVAGGAGGGAWCAVCPWPALCRGCVLPPTRRRLLRTGCSNRCRKRSQEGAETDADEATEQHEGRRPASRLSSYTDGAGEITSVDPSVLRRPVMLAVDWDPTALHLQYQSTREKAWREDASAAESARPVDLASCLRAFTSSERLDERYCCQRCSSAQPATKKLQIWRAPPVLIIHLKRFQYVNNKWIKSQKVVNFPFEDFDPTEYLASVPQETLLRHRELSEPRLVSAFGDIDEAASGSDTDPEPDGPAAAAKEAPKVKTKVDRKNRRESLEIRRRERLQSTSLATTPVTDDNLVDYHHHHLEEDQDPFDLKYTLYAVVSHSGQLSGGHYVSYARAAAGGWVCHNDSSVRPAPAALDPAAAYLLFYERRGLRARGYLPRVAGPPPAPAAPADPARAARARLPAARRRPAARARRARRPRLPRRVRTGPDRAAPAALDPAAAYLLFYERRGLRARGYLPRVAGPPPAVARRPPRPPTAPAASRGPGPRRPRPPRPPTAPAASPEHRAGPGRTGRRTEPDRRHPRARRACRIV